MLKTVLRKEHKNKWEQRAALTPVAIKALATKGYAVDVESSEIRIFTDEQYQNKHLHEFHQIHLKNLIPLNNHSNFYFFELIFRMFFRHKYFLYILKIHNQIKV